jgi:adenylosuccinate synthase
VRVHIVISGDLCAGKTTLATGLQANAGYATLSARQVLRDIAGHELGSRRALQDFGLATDLRTRGRWLGDAAEQRRSTDPNVLLVVDSARNERQVQAVRDALKDEAVLHVHLTAERDELERRFTERTDADDAFLRSLDEARRHPIEGSDAVLEQTAGVVIDTTSLSPNEVLNCVIAAVELE